MRSATTAKKQADSNVITLQGQAVSENHAVALEHYRRGFAVFPCKEYGPDGVVKTPYTANGHKDASRDLEQINFWWGENPGALVGVATGRVNDITVLDLDMKNGKDGIATMRDLGYDPTEMSPFSVCTPTGGLHIYRLGDKQQRNTNGKLAGEPASGVDVRGEGGYVIGAGSRLKDGTCYRFAGESDWSDLDSLPRWPAAFLAPEREPRAARDDDHDELPLRDVKAILAELQLDPEWVNPREAWRNVGMALHHEFDGSDEGRDLWEDFSTASATWQESPSKAKREVKSQWASFHGRNPLNPITMATLIDAAHEWRFARDQADAIAEMDEGDDLIGDDKPAKPDRHRGLTFTRPSEIAQGEPRPYIIKGMFAERDVVAIVGAPGVGKSLLAPYLALAVAQGREVFGQRVRAGGVFYVAAEDEAGMGGRIRALDRQHGDAPEFQLVGGVSDLLAKGSPNLKALTAAVKEQRPALIIIDTLAMAFPGLEENSAEGMGRVVAVARSLTRWGAAVVLIHHDTKDGQQGLPRGHSLLNGALDVSLYLKRGEDGIIRGKLSKNRNGSCDLDLAFRIEVENLGEDADGDPITAAYAAPLAGASEPSLPRLNRNERAALGALSDLSGDDGTADLDAWRDSCIADRSVFDSEDRANRRKAFDRAQAGLIEKQRITLRDMLVFCIARGSAATEFDDD